MPWLCYGGLLSLSSMAVPTAMLESADVQLSGAGSRLRLSTVTIPERPAAGELTGTMTVGQDGSQAVDPPNWGIADPRWRGPAGLALWVLARDLASGVFIVRARHQRVSIYEKFVPRISWRLQSVKGR